MSDTERPARGGNRDTGLDEQQLAKGGSSHQEKNTPSPTPQVGTPASPKYTHTITIVRPRVLLHWATSGLIESARQFMQAIKNWGEESLSPPLCLSCGRKVSTVDPTTTPAFLYVEVGIEPTQPPTQTIISAICAACATRTDSELLTLGLNELRRTWPDTFDGQGQLIEEPVDDSEIH